jgi:hypothetical protein
MAELTSWKKSENYMGEEYPDYYVLPFGHTRDSTLLEEANFQAALKELGGENAPGVLVPRAGHWAVGWVEPLLVKKDVKKTVEKAEELVDRFEQYPVLDDDLYYRMEYEAGIANIKDAGYRYGLTEKEAVDVYGWLSDNGNNMESTDDTGFYPNDEELETAVKAIRSKQRSTGSKKKAKTKKSSPSSPQLRSMR